MESWKTKHPYSNTPLLRHSNTPTLQQSICSMRVIIVGLGEVGSYIAKILSSQEKYDVVGVDIDKQRLAVLEDTYDVQTLEGYGAAPYVLKQAEADKADIFLAVSDNDEVNIVASLIAKKLGVPFTICRVSNPFYLEDQHLEEYQDLGINLMISPERRTALTIYQSIEFPHFLKVDTLGDGRVHINQYQISPHSPFAYKKIKDLSLTTDMLIVGITRKRNFLFPTGDTVILPNDTLFIVAKKETMQNVESFLPVEHKEIKRIILLGASRISYFLAKLVEKKYRVMIIEEDRDKSDQIAQLLHNTVMYNDNIFKSNIFNDLLINEHDYVIAATHNDEFNLLSSILVQDRGLSMIACIIHSSYLLSTIEKAGIHQVFSPQIIISNDIASAIRERGLLTLQNFQNVSAEFIELTVKPGSVLIERSLEEISLPPQTLFVAVMRGKEVFIPRGDFVLHEADRAVVLSLKANVDIIEKLFHST